MLGICDFPNVDEVRLSMCEAADFREAAELVQRAALRLHGVDAVGIYAFDSNKDFHLVSHAGVSLAAADAFRHFPSSSYQARLVMYGDPIYRRVKELPPDRAILYEREGMQAIAIYPIQHKGQVVGSLHIGTRQLPEIPHELGEQIQVFVQSLGNAIARITYEAMAHRAYENLEVEVRKRTLELQKAFDALRWSEGKFRALADVMPQLVWTAKSDGTLDYCNQRVEDYVGFRHNPDGTWNCDGLTHPDDRIAAMKAWQHSVANGTSYQQECRLRLGSGEYRWHLCRATPVRDEDGHVAKWYGTSTDIDDLVRFRQQLEDAQRRKDNFIAMLGHELRNPLAPIRNVVHALKHNGSSDPRVQHSYDVIERQVAHMARLVDDLLDVSRITHGKIQLRKSVIDIAQIVHGCAEDFQPLMDAAGLKFQVCLPGAPVPVFGDSARVQQIISNLLSNALKFTDAGGSVVLNLTSSPTHAEIRVQDSGIGMDPEVLERVFHPFSQADQSSVRRGGGLGLGLALVRGLVELHGGEVHAESRGSGSGSIFTVRLPIEQSASNSIVIAPASDPAPAVRRILIIEDNVDAAETLEMLLSTMGHEVAVAYTGADGVKKAAEFRPEVIFCDIGLPGDMNGYDVVRELRRRPECSKVNAVAITGYGQPEDRRRAKEAGFDHFLVKPASPEALLKLLEQEQSE